MARGLTRALMAVLGVAVLVVSADAYGQGKAPPRKKPPGPPRKMKFEEVFISQNYCLVELRFYDGAGKKVSVKTGKFLYWSNFLKGKRQSQKKRTIELKDANHHKAKYTLKLPGIGKVCPPRIARLKITYVSKTPRLRFVKHWKKKATCR